MNGPVGLHDSRILLRPISEDDRASLSVILAEPDVGRWWVHDIGPDAIRLVARHLFDVRGHHRLTIDPAVANIRAIRAYEKVGFRPVGVMRRYERGTDGEWHDGLLLDLLREEFVA